PREVVVRLPGRVDRPGLAQYAAGIRIQEHHRALEGVAVGLVTELGCAARDADQHGAAEDDRAAVDVGARLTVDRGAAPRAPAGGLVEGGDVGADALLTGRAAVRGARTRRRHEHRPAPDRLLPGDPDPAVLRPAPAMTAPGRRARAVGPPPRAVPRPVPGLHLAP